MKTITSVSTIALSALLAACGGGGTGEPESSIPVSQAPSNPNNPPSSSVPAAPPAPIAGNAAPVADAGAAQTVKSGKLVTLNGLSSQDADGDALTYLWQLVSRPKDSTASLSGFTGAEPTFTPDMAGSYVFSLTVNDGKSNSAAATVEVTVESVKSAAYDSMPTPFPLNMSSVGAEAYAFKNVGQVVTLAHDVPRLLDSVTIGMSSWACESGAWNLGTCESRPGATFAHPITLRLFNSAGDEIAKLMKEVDVPYRPSFNTACEDPKKWQGADGGCFNGYAFKIVFDMSSLKVTLPETVRFAVEYNTNRNGPEPLGTTGGWDALNVGLYTRPVAPTSGVAASAVLKNGDAWLADYGIMAQIQTTTP